MTPLWKSDTVALPASMRAKNISAVERAKAAKPWADASPKRAP